MSRGRRLSSCLLSAALAASLAACGGGSSPTTPTPTPTPVPTPPPPQVVAQGSDTLEAEFTGRLAFTTTRAGMLEATVDWTYATNDVDVALVQGDCSFEQAVAQQCTVLAFSVSTTAKPEKITASNAAAGTYTLFIENTGPGDESVAFQVVLTPTTAAAPPSASARAESGTALGLKRKPRGFVELR